MFYYTYKITNLINEKIYIGVHKTTDLEDGYMGSGKVLNRAKDKHGIENFHKEILKFHETQEEMFAHEAELVTRDFIARNDVYNIKLGGEGGWDYVNSNTSIETRHIRAALSLESRRNHEKSCEKFSKHMSNLKSMSNKTRWTDPSYREKLLVNLDRTGKKHSEETKLKLSISAKGKHKGEKNSQFGKMWIHSLEERKSTRINNNEPIPNGWKKGRKMFKN